MLSIRSHLLQWEALIRGKHTDGQLRTRKLCVPIRKMEPLDIFHMSGEKSFHVFSKVFHFSSPSSNCLSSWALFCNILQSLQCIGEGRFEKPFSFFPRLFPNIFSPLFKNCHLHLVCKLCSVYKYTYTSHVSGVASKKVSQEAYG